MSTQEATITALQSRVEYLEAHLHLALEVLREIEQDNQDLSQSLDSQFQSQTIDVIPTSKVELPTFLNHRTWKHHLEAQPHFKEQEQQNYPVAKVS
jgi:hypothetical protein